MGETRRIRWGHPLEWLICTAVVLWLFVDATLNFNLGDIVFLSWALTGLAMSWLGYLEGKTCTAVPPDCWPWLRPRLAISMKIAGIILIGLAVFAFSLGVDWLASKPFGLLTAGALTLWPGLRLLTQPTTTTDGGEKDGASPIQPT